MFKKVEKLLHPGRAGIFFDGPVRVLSRVYGCGCSCKHSRETIQMGELTDLKFSKQETNDMTVNIQ